MFSALDHPSVMEAGFGIPQFSLFCVSGLALGVASGVRRSFYVAQSLDENSVETVFFNGQVVFDMVGKTTVPETRRRAVIAHLAALGIQSGEDIIRLKDPGAILQPRELNKSAFRTSTPSIFAEKYQYLNF